MIDTSKIIHAPINGSRYTETAPLWKEHYGIYLKIEGADLPETYEVDFSNDEFHGSSVTMIGNADGVLIPHQFIDTGKDVFAFLYWVGEDFGKTVYKFKIPNKVRPDRTNEQPIPEQQSVIDQAIAALNDAVEQTAQDVASAHGYAQASASNAESASASAQSADASREAADESEYNAQVYAESAQASATASARSASQSAQIKDDVESMVDDAQGYATASAQSASASANSASQASGYAQGASASAQSASGYASQAQTSAQTASSKATEASTSASTASAKATESAQSATSAQGYAQAAESAKTASQTAQGLAEQAQTGAETAQGLAEDARDEAQSIVDGISGKVEQIDSNTERIESLEEDRYKPYAVDSASGAIASFSDGADDIPLKSLVVNIDPVQDLHGYDSPWVGGGGKNKLFLTATTTTINGVTFTVNDDGTIVANGTASDDIVFEIWSKAQNSGNVLLPAGQYIVNGGANGGGTSTYRVGSNGFAWSGGTLKTETDSLTFTITENEAQTNIWIQVFNGTSLSNVVFKPMIRLASVADATFAPYENICPISGWTGVQLFKTGKNLLGGSKLLANAQNYIPNGTTNTEEEYFQFSSGASTDNDYRFSTDVPFKENTQYTFIFTLYKVSGTGTNIRVNYTDGSYSAFTPVSSAGVKETVVYVSSNGKTILNVTKSNMSSSTRIYYNESGVFEGILTADQFEQFGKYIPISWQTEAGTVYGGKLDVLSGVMRVEWLSADGGDLTWSKINDYNYGNFYTLPTPLASYVATRPTVISSSYKSESNQSAPSTGDSYVWIRSISASNRRIYVKDTSKASMTAEEFQTAMTGVQFVYELATPLEIQLDAHTLNSLYGQNNIFADTGDTSCEYRADTKLYIEKLTQPEEDDMIADSAITSGQFFMVGNSLYRALANIASGATITVGTNAQRVSLADALNLINT